MAKTLILSLALASTILAAPPPSRSWHRPSTSSGSPPWSHHPSGVAPYPGAGNKAAYFLDNNPNGSSLISLRIDPRTGTLSDPYRTSTGGVGSITINATSMMPVPADSLQSQGSVIVAGEKLFTVNPGSNEVVLFEIDPQSPWSPKLIGKVGTMGGFPTSVAVDEAGKTVCVLNGGAKAGVACFFITESGLTPQGSLRDFSKTIFNETTPPTGPPGTASQVLFTPNQKTLLAILKGNSSTGTSHIISYPVFTNGVVSETGTVNPLPWSPQAFGASWINSTHLFLSDTVIGSSIVDVSDPKNIKEVVPVPLPGEAASCWTAYDAQLGNAYALDAGKPVLYIVDVEEGKLTGTINATMATAGIFDSALMDGKLYSLTAANAVAVFDLATKEEIQLLNLTGFGERQGYDGMAVWPAGWSARRW